MDERAKRLARVAEKLEEAKAEIARVAAEIDGDGPEQVARRRMLGLGAGLVAGAAAMTAMPKDAKAQFFGGGGISMAALAAALYEAFVDGITDTIQDPIDGILDATVLGQIFDLPPSVVRMINDLLELVFGSADTVISDAPEEVLEVSYPTVIPGNASPESFDEATVEQTRAIRARVVQAERICARSVFDAGQIAMEEQEIIASAQAAAQGGNGSLAALMAAQIAMLGSMSNRLGATAANQAAQAQLLADLVMRDANAKEQALLIAHARRAGAGETISPAVDRPTR